MSQLTPSPPSVATNVDSAEIQRAPVIIHSTGPFPDFTPAPDEPCFCASGKRFADCCGSTAEQRPPPYGVFVVEHYLDPAVIRDLADFARARSGERLMVIDREASTADNIVKVDDPRRVSERVDLGPRRAEINRLIGDIYRDLARKFLGAELDWYESPELMRYRPGGLYIKHADSQNMNPETRQWTKVIDRDLSLLVYLNDDYEGGALRFDKFNYRLRPRAGMVVLFPSDNRYVHAAEQVTAGERYVIVSWAAVRGVPKVGKKPPEPALFFS
jgi:predicted 2-oxoglutarate/Fe(II)-dependent dioxygenase YbiX